jgi:hypothetical protein
LTSSQFREMVSNTISIDFHGLIIDLSDQCADCKARAPRWTSFNLGIFLWFVLSYKPFIRLPYTNLSVHCATGTRSYRDWSTPTPL